MPYLQAMVQLARISYRVWYAGVGTNRPGDIKTEEIGYLDYQVLQCRQRLPRDLQFRNPETGELNELSTDAGRRLQYLIHLRVNSLRMFVHKRVLQSPAYMTEHHDLARVLVEVAKDSIKILEKFSNITQITFVDKITFNSFLVSAISILFLAACQQPGKFVTDVRSQFITALSLMNAFATPSALSNQFMAKISSVRSIGMRVGLISPDLSNSATTSSLSGNLTGDTMLNSTAHPSSNQAINLQGVDNITGFSLPQIPENDNLASQFAEAMFYDMHATPNYYWNPTVAGVNVI